MELPEVVLVLGSIWSVIGGAYLLYQVKSRHDTELEEYRQLKISERRMAAPKEWWQEVVVNLSQNPEIISKLLPMVPPNLVEQALANLRK